MIPRCLLSKDFVYKSLKSLVFALWAPNCSPRVLASISKDETSKYNCFKKRQGSKGAKEREFAT